MLLRDDYLSDILFETVSDNIFCLEFFGDIDNLAEPFWNIEGPKTAPKYNLTQFSLQHNQHYRKITV